MQWISFEKQEPREGRLVFCLSITELVLVKYDATIKGWEYWCPVIIADGDTVKIPRVSDSWDCINKQKERVIDKSREELVDRSEKFILITDGWFWGPNKEGYVLTLPSAGRYTLEEAKTYRSNHTYFMPESSAPYYSPKAASHSKIEDLSSRVLVLEEGISGK